MATVDENDQLKADRDTAINALRLIAAFRPAARSGVEPHVQAARFAWQVANRALGTIDGHASPAIRPEFHLDPNED